MSEDPSSLAADHDGQVVEITEHEGWAQITLSRPHRKNAITAPMADQLAESIASLGARSEVAAIVLAGAGGSFCSGIDLKELQADPPRPWRDRLGSSLRSAHLELYRCPKPLIGALERFAINAGSALALACDLLVCGEGAFLQVGEIQQGAAIPMNAAWLQIRAGEAVAARVALYGDRLPAADLLRLGLVSEISADDRVVVRAGEIAAAMAGHPAGAPARIKAELRAQSKIGDPEEWFRVSEGGTLLTAPPVAR